MAIQLSEEEQKLLKEGKLDLNDLIKQRQETPAPLPAEPDKSELEQVKQEIRETNILYRQAIDKNKELYEELLENRKLKEEFRNKIAELRIKKKKLLGIE